MIVLVTLLYRFSDTVFKQFSYSKMLIKYKTETRNKYNDTTIVLQRYLLQQFFVSLCLVNLNISVVYVWCC